MQQAEAYRPAQVEGALTDLVQTLHRIKANVNVRLALDVLALRLPYRPPGRAMMRKASLVESAGRVAITS